MSVIAGSGLNQLQKKMKIRKCIFYTVHACRKGCISTLHVSTLYARQEGGILIKGLFYGCILFENLAQCTNHALLYLYTMFLVENTEF